MTMTELNQPVDDVKFSAQVCPRHEQEGRAIVRQRVKAHGQRLEIQR
jgi:hypothetical protein